MGSISSETKMSKTTPCTVAKFKLRLHIFRVPTGASIIAQPAEKPLSDFGLPRFPRLPADIAAAKTFRPANAVDRLVGARLRLRHGCPKRAHIEHAAAIGEDRAVFL